MSASANDLIINQRLNEHESENSNTIPSISRCSNDLMIFLNAYINNDPSLEAKRYTLLNTLDSFKFLLERLPTTEDSLTSDLNNFIHLQKQYRKQIQDLMVSKEQVETEMKEAHTALMEMNEVEKKSIEVNSFESQQTIEKKIEATIHHTEHIESDIQNLKNRMVHDSELLMNLYNEFVKLKHEILGIDMDDEDNMEVEE